MMYQDMEYTVIEVGAKLVWQSSGRGSSEPNQIVEVIKVHKDNSFRVEGAGLKHPDNRFTGYKVDWGEDAGKIRDRWFRGHGQTPGSCRSLREGETQEQFDAEFARIEAERQAKRDERQAAVDAAIAAVHAANTPLIEQTKTDLDLDGFCTVELVDQYGTRMRVFYKISPKAILLWQPEVREVEGVELCAAVHGRSRSISSGFTRFEQEGFNEVDALLSLAYRLW